MALDPSVVDVDVATFEHEGAAGTPKALQHAVNLYRGDLLAGLALQEPPFEEWLRTERQRLRELASQYLTKLVGLYHRDGATEPAIQTALRLLALDPLQETVHRILMRLYADAGRRGSAIRQYEACVSILQRELGVEPEAETRELHEEISRAHRRRTLSAKGVAAAAAPPEAALVGRDAERAQLGHALTDAMANRGRVIGVLGEEGIGKTRLMTELAHEASRRGAALLVGRAYESEQSLPLGPWADALRAADLTGNLAVLEGFEPARRAQLGVVLALPTGHEGPRDELAAREVFESVLQLVHVLAVQQPVVIILEDLQWADQMTVRLAAFLGHRLNSLPVLLVMTAREDALWDAPHLVGVLGELARDPHVSRLDLSALTKADTMALVRALSRPGAESLDVLAEQVWAVSEGNPFVVVEAMRAVEGGPAAVPSLPPRVREMVERRLERLSEPAQQLVATAAVIARDFEFSVLQRASRLSVGEAADGVDDLVRRRVFHDIGARLDFVHNRLRETAIARLLPHRRAMLHAAVAEAIESVYGERLEAYDVALGVHYRGAGLWDRALLYSGRAGLRALSHGAHHEAVRLLQHTLEALDRLPEADVSPSLRADLLFALAEAHFGLGATEDMLGILRSIETIAAAAGDRRRLRRSLEGMSVCLGNLGDLAGAIHAIERSAAIGTGSGKPVPFAPLAARPYYAVGDYRRAAAAARFEIDDLRAAGVSTRRWRLLSFLRAQFLLTLSLTELGEFVEALRITDDMLGTAERTRLSEHLICACLAAGRVHLVKGELPTAITALERIAPICRNGDDYFIYLSRICASLGLAYVGVGRVEEGLELLCKAAQADASARFVYNQPFSLLSLAEGQLLAGDVEEAERSAARALEVARRHGHRGWEGWTLWLQGEIARHRGLPAQGAGFYREAMALAEERGMRPLLAHCHRGLAGLGPERRTQAKHHLTTAHTLYREMGMTLWLS